MDTSDFYRVPPERWDTELCNRVARTREKDGMGTPAPWPGLRVDLKSGPERHNGGVTRQAANGEVRWYPGVVYSLPIVPAAFAWVRIPTWGWRLVWKGESAQ